MCAVTPIISGGWKEQEPIPVTFWKVVVTTTSGWGVGCCREGQGRTRRGARPSAAAAARAPPCTCPSPPASSSPPSTTPRPGAASAATASTCRDDSTPPPLYVRRLDPTARDHRDGAVTQQVGAPSARRLCRCIIASGAACLSFSRRLARARGGMRAWVVQVGRGARDGWWRGGLAYHARAVARRMHGGSCRGAGAWASMIVCENCGIAVWLLVGPTTRRWRRGEMRRKAAAPRRLFM